jgi:dipeptidyl aminopeptidase/acylaminoacyl peptidase
VYLFDEKKGSVDSIFFQRGISKKISLDEKGNQLAFIHTNDTAKTKVFELYFFNGDTVNKIIDTNSVEIPKNWTLQKNSKLYFSKKGNRLFFTTNLRPEQEPDDTLLDEEKVKVDIWHWDDPRIQPEQNKNLNKDKARTFLAVYNIKDKRIFQLADSTLPAVRTLQHGNSPIALGVSNLKYRKETNWNMPYKRDIYVVNLDNGERELLLEGYRGYASLSAAGNYIICYEPNDSCWYSINLTTKKKINLTADLEINFFDEEHDMPMLPDPYGVAGWTNDDKYVLIYDAFDIWKIKPDGSEKTNLTNGRVDSVKYRYHRMDYERYFVEDTLMLTVFDNKTKDGGYSTYTFETKELKNLVKSSHYYSWLYKSKYANKILWSTESFNEYPELKFSNIDFSDTKTLTSLGNQINQYYWGNAKLVSWKSLTGEQLEGLLYKPENFDSEKKYPMIVYFYETYSNSLHRFYKPKPSRSVINFPLYTSNDYIIFIPDIHYTTGQPGQDAYNAIISGTDFMISKGYIDPDKIGIQGQSWGGYQVAYLVTQTDKYAAGMAGAPVSNMTSAYGGIRWGSGMSRMFQYEKTQSRLGVTLWEDRETYIKNSPVFFADKVTTPLLIMHNDNDGAVPWYQGIEYYMALRRLEKKVWMLTYNNEEHNLRDRPNCIDLSLRMMQFFDHYLKDYPAPYWMNYGIPAIEKGKEFGYELLEENNDTE